MSANVRPAVPSGGAEPVAVVGMGLVVPGAETPAQFWHLLRSGRRVLGQPTGRWGLEGYFSSDEGAQDRSYARELGFAAAGADTGCPDLAGSWLRSALRQATCDLPPQSQGLRSCFIVAGSADVGQGVLDSMAASSLRQWTRGRPEAGALDEVAHLALPLADDRAADHLPYRVAWRAREGILPETTDLLMVDSACASGLYAVDLAVRRLRSGAADLAVCGAMSMANWRDGILFAKLGGLSRRGELRCMDAEADGMLYADGAAAVVLKTLRRARLDGDRILGVIAGTGVSCDGAGKAIYAMNPAGVQRAVRLAWQDSGLEPSRADVILAHSTATKAGDRAEMTALRECFMDAEQAYVVSNKAVIGHSAWAAGLVSLVHALLILERGMVPRQHRCPDPGHELPTGLLIPAEDVIMSRARRTVIGVSASGFGGVNAHLVLTGPHAALRVDGAPGMAAPVPEDPVVCCAWDVYLPGEAPRQSVQAWLAGGREASEPAPVFGASLRPATYADVALPEAAIAVMDRTQLFALRAARRLAGQLGQPALDALGSRTGVIAAHTGPTTNGVRYAERCSLGLLAAAATERPAGVRDALDEYSQHVRSQIPPSSKDSYPGLLPNVIAGRVANALNLNGLDMVVDTGEDSALQALRAAADYLAGDGLDAAIVLAVNGCSAADWTGSVGGMLPAPGTVVAEGAVAFALTRRSIAEQYGLPILAEIDRQLADDDEPSLQAPAMPGRTYLAADGAFAVLKAIVGDKARSVAAADPTSGRRTLLSIRPTRESTTCAADPRPPVVRHIVRLEPLEDIGARAVSAVLPPSCLIVSNLPAPFAGRTPPPQHCLIQVADLAEISDATVEQALATADSKARHVRVVASVDQPLDALRKLNDLIFLAAKAWCQSAGPESTFAVLLLGAVDGTTPRPATGLFTGLVKGLAVEMPNNLVYALLVPDTDLNQQVWERFEAESALARPTPSVVWDGHRRLVHSPVPAPISLDGAAPLALDCTSVVVAAGGARGIGAKILADLAERARPTIWILGSTPPAPDQQELAHTSNEELDRLRAEHIRAHLGHGRTPVALSREFDQLLAAARTQATLDTLRRICGTNRVHFLPCDITDPEAVDTAMATITTAHPTIDLLMLIAGTVRSSLIVDKPLADYRRVRDVKVLGHANLHKALSTRPPRLWCNFGSISGYFGCRGDADYAAGNDYLATAAEHAADRLGRSEWTVGWTLWAGTGLSNQNPQTRRKAEQLLNWTGLTAAQGVELFLDELRAPTAAAHRMLFGPEELAVLARRFASIRSQRASNAGGDGFLRSIDQSKTDRVQAVCDFGDPGAPMLAGHLINGQPTVPGMLLAEASAQAALTLEPNLALVALEHVRFLRYVRPEPSRTWHIRADRKPTTGRTHRIHVCVSCDLHTRSGLLLGQSIPYFTADVLLADHESEPSSHQCEPPATFNGPPVPDPCYEPDAVVQLTGPFRNTTDLRIDDGRACARFDAPLSSPPSLQLPVLVLDATARTALSACLPDEAAVLVGIERIVVRLGNDHDLTADSRGGITLYGHSTGADEAQMLRAAGQAVAADGRVLVEMSGVAGRAIASAARPHIPA